MVTNIFSSLVMGMWGANTFLMCKQLPNLSFQYSQTFFLVVLTFSSNKCWWRLPHVFLFGKRSFGFSPALPSYGRLQQMETPLGTIRDLSHSISVQCFIVTSSLFMLPLLFYLLFCPYLCMNFAMLLCLVCVCLSITFVVRNIFVLCTHGTYTFAHTLRY